MKSKILFIASLLYGLMFLNAGLNKFFNYIPMPEDLPEKAMSMFSAMMQLEWLMPLIATAEIIGGILFIIPKTRALAAVMMVPLMVGILCHHFVLGMGFPIPLALTAILIWVIVENWEKYLPMVQQGGINPAD